MMSNIRNNDTVDLFEDVTVCSLYAQVMFGAQALEYTLTNLNLICHIAKVGRTFVPNEIDDLLENIYTKTFGCLLPSLEGIVEIPTRLVDELRKAKEARNYLCHRFFRENTSDLFATKDRKTIIKELLDLYDLFRELNDQVNAVTTNVALKYNVASEISAEELSRISI